MKIAHLVVGVLCLSSHWLFSQSFHAEVNAQIGPYTDSRLDTRLRIKTGQWFFGNSGILIENSQNRAHTWLPYKDGSIYLTGDGIERVQPDGSVEGGDGNIILRTYGSEGYQNIMVLDGASKTVKINSLAQEIIPFPITDTGNSLILANRQGELVRKERSEIWSASAVDMGRVSPMIKFLGHQPKESIGVHLPNGVKIRAVKAIVNDENQNSDVYFQFHTYDYIERTLRMVAWGKSDGTPGETSFWAETFGDQVINNDTNAYHITVGGTGPPENFIQAPIEFYSIHVYYDY